MMETSNTNVNGKTHSAAKSSNGTEITMNQKWAAIEDATIEPERKKIRLDTIVKETKPNIDNLEYFPNNVLLNIFAQTDDIGLLHLFEVSCRFASIILTVFEKRYSNDSFVINSARYGGDQEIYCALFKRFGKFIKAIEVNHEQLQWLRIFLRDDSEHKYVLIKKLTFNDCIFESDHSLPHYMPITHLTLRNNCCTNSRELPKCCDLVKLEIHGCNYVSDNSLNRTIGNNSSLQNLILNDRRVSAKTITSIAENLNHLKQLSIDSYSGWASVTPDVIDRMAKALKHLESLNLTLDFDNIRLFRRLSMECKSLKYLKLRFCNNDLATQLFELVRSFRQIESLHLMPHELNREQLMKINSMVEHLSHLRELSFELALKESILHLETICLFHKCPSLEKITNISTMGLLESHTLFIDPRIFENFIENIITGKPNARIEVHDDGQIIYSVSKNGVVWRNKLVHWIGCDTNRSSSNVQLLDLAKEKVKSNAVQKNLLDLVFDYLDVRDLCAFAETTRRSKQFVEDYIPKHSQQRGTFTITNKFKSYNLLKKGNTFIPNIFAQHVTDLKIDPINDKYLNDILKIIGNYGNLKKLTICSGNIQFYFWFSVLKQVKHFIFDTSHFMGYSDLYELSAACSNVETVEFKKATPFHDFKPGESEPLKFRNMKKFTFQYRSETQMNKIKKLFENSDTQLIPMRQI